MPRFLSFIIFSITIIYTQLVSRSDDILLEAESFEDLGGWKLDTQFIEQMGSPYLLAHGLGIPVADAMTEFKVQKAGKHTIWVRTFDWVARWNVPGTPGRFALTIDDHELSNQLGTIGAAWQWHRAGEVHLSAGNHRLTLQDLTGFDGRCDAIFITSNDQAVPDNSSDVLSTWRQKMLGLDSRLTSASYDLVVIGGGYSGLGAAISAARMGCKVALLQDRGVLGGNGSSEVRVWAQGNIRRGKYPRIGEIVEEFADSATKSPGRADEFGDEVKLDIVQAEANIALFLHHHAFRVAAHDGVIQSVDAVDTKTSQVRRFEAPLFADCTGHGTIGFLAEADWDMTPTGRMGMSNMWTWDEIDHAPSFPPTPWALQLKMEDFPYPRDHHGQWFWESGFDKDPIGDAEGIRDWNLRAVYGAFSAMKNGDGAADHQRATLTWIAYVGGPRESRRLMGDVVLTQDDIVNKRDFDDGFVPSTWSIDLHYPKEQFIGNFSENPFISIAEHDNRVDRQYGYPVPYRCFYSRNVDNLFMAGRCISVTHEALGTVRVMKTCGMMGEVVGKAASLCRQYDCSPRDVYTSHLSELTQLIQLPGKARRNELGGETVIPDDALPLASSFGPETGRQLASLDGIVVDDESAQFMGKWTSGQGLKGYVAFGYRYASPDSNATAMFELPVPQTGRFALRAIWLPHENRAKKAPVDVKVDGKIVSTILLDMSHEAGQDDFAELATLSLVAGSKVAVVFRTDHAGGLVHVDAVQLKPIK
ncbi:MAG: FAD-dependent oxidoreductase [Planctomycetales bacterium]|nr:FAD-dependent oxidoreductase [Planctomycetales bacterium]